MNRSEESVQVMGTLEAIFLERAMHDMTIDLQSDGFGVIGQGGLSDIDSSDESVTADLFALYLKGKILLGRTRPASADARSFAGARVLERRAASLMLLGRELEAVAVNEELVRRFSGVPEAADIVARARFNAGCAYARIGIVEKASEQFAAVMFEDPSMNEYHRMLSKLVDEGIRQTEEMSRQIVAHRQRAQERRRAMGWK